MKIPPYKAEGKEDKEERDESRRSAKHFDQGTRRGGRKQDSYRIDVAGSRLKGRGSSERRKKSGGETGWLVASCTRAGAGICCQSTAMQSRGSPGSPFHLVPDRQATLSTPDDLVDVCIAQAARLRGLQPGGSYCA